MYKLLHNFNTPIIYGLNPSAMDKVTRYMPATFLNVIAFFTLQVVAQFAYFQLFSNGGINQTHLKLVGLFFVLMQIALLCFLYFKKFLIEEKQLAIINILFAIGLYLIFIVFNLMAYIK